MKYVQFLLLLFFINNSNAQSNLNPKSEDIALAKSLYERYEKEKVVVLNKVVDITFNLARRTNLVEVTQVENLTLMSIVPSTRLQYPLFYDSESEVKKFQGKSQTGRSLGNSNFNIRDEHLKSQELFHTDYRVKFANINFPLKGTTYTIETEKHYKDIKYFTSEYFSMPYRIQQGKLRIEIPNWLDLEILEFNFEGHTISKSVNSLDANKVYEYVFKDINPQVNETNKPGPSHLYPHLLFIAKSFKDGDREHILFSSVDNLYEWYSSLVDMVEVDTTVFEDRVKELTANASSDQEKISAIFYWVQDNIRYIAFEDGIAGFKPDSPQNVYNKRYGDCKGMAILTKSMLEVAGFDSRLVWIGTDRLNYDYSIPSLSVDNHMICAVLLNEELIFLDGTEKYNKFGEYASRIQNKQALVEDKDGFKIVKVPKTSETKNTNKTIYTLKIENESLIGKAKRKYSSESRVAFQNGYTSIGRGSQADILPKYLASGNSNFNVKNIIPFDENHRDSDLVIDFDVSIEKAFYEFGGTYYIDIDPNKIASNYIFEDRKADFFASMKEQLITEILLEIPEGLKVGSLPEGMNVSNDLVDIEVKYLVKGNTILFTKNIHLKERRIPHNRFDIWNQSFQELRNNLTQQITLIKN